ncbi:MAG: hypothetical protein Q7S21_02420, partial [archaeon]|nr:hypothetical protein [archaeon]
LHEFGHDFGKLADEYVEPKIGNYPRSPNCAPDISTAQSWWGGIVGAGTFYGCSYVESNIRPTKNSIMRSHYVLKDDYGPVNSKELEKILNNYR